MQVKLVCTDLVALARSRPNRHSGNRTVRRSRRFSRGRFSPLEAGQKLLFGAGHLIALKPSECPLWGAGSTDRCNTFCELLSRRLIEQGLSRPFVELPGDGTELGLAVQRQIGAARKILAQ